MAKFLHCCWFISCMVSLIYDFKVNAVPYNSTFTPECLPKPDWPLYNGGIVVNPELNQGLKGWTISGDANIALGESSDGNKYIVASQRKQSSFTQTFFLKKGILYSLSAWLQVSDGDEVAIGAIFYSKTINETAGSVIAQKGCWSMLKGGLTVNTTGPVQLYFQSYNSTADIWADSISLQPFTKEEWTSHQNDEIETTRKGEVHFEVVHKKGHAIANATISIKQLRPDFPFGCTINANLVGNPKFQNWFLSRFKYTVLENEMKWYATEIKQGIEDYSIADALVKFAQDHNITIRGHTVLWNNPRMQTQWVPGLSPAELQVAVNRRINSVVSRYRGKLIHWDVVNENMHYDFFESRLGPNASAVAYEMTHKIDGEATPFLNEFHTVERSIVGSASPSRYLRKIAELRRQGYNGPLGIGLQAHFSVMNLPYTRAVLDQLATAGLPMWITELDMKEGPYQTIYLEEILRELHSYSKIEGIVMWGAWNENGCFRMCLTDQNFKNLPTGDVVDKFIAELTHAAGKSGTTDSHGVFRTRLYVGDYQIQINLPNGSSFSKNIVVRRFHNYEKIEL